MFATVTIQTYNHAARLDMALASLTSLVCPDDSDYEILVVNNDSSDATQAVVESHANALGARLRCVCEPEPGLSRARNRAIAEARGEVICFMDDDALADAGWLAGHIAAYRQNARTVAVGGRVILQWPQGWSRPKWLAAALEGYLSGVDLGQDPRTLRYPSYPYGCNMSVRRVLARELGGFAPSLGRRAASLVSNEEKHFFFKVDRFGGRVVYAPDAVVRHVISHSRLSRSFFVRRAYAQGISDVIFRRLTAEPCSPAANFLRGAKQFVAAAGQGVSAHAAAKGSSTRFASLVRMAYAMGVVVGEATVLRRPSDDRDGGAAPGGLSAGVARDEPINAGCAAPDARDEGTRNHGSC